MKRLLLMLLLFSPALAVSQQVLVVELMVDVNDSVVINSLEVTQGSVSTGSGPYAVSLLADDLVLSSVNFSVVFSLPEFPADFNLSELNLSDPFDSEFLTLIRLPYSSSATSLRVSKGDAVLLEQSFSFCNQDGVCDPGENFFSCFWDCPSGSLDGLCDELFDSVCDPDCVSQGRADRDPDCTCGNSVCDPRETNINCPLDCGAPVNELQNLVFLIIGGGAAIIAAIIILIVWLVRRRRKKKKAKPKPKSPAKTRPKPKAKKKSAKKRKKGK